VIDGLDKLQSSSANDKSRMLKTSGNGRKHKSDGNAAAMAHGASKRCCLIDNEFSNVDDNEFSDHNMNNDGSDKSSNSNED